MCAQAHDRWGHVEELLVQITERIDLLLRVTVMANADPKKSKPNFGPQFHYPRPGGAPQVETVKVVRPGELVGMFRGGG